MPKKDLTRQLADAEQALLTRRSPNRVQEYLAEKYHVSHRTARRWIAAVQARWREEAAGDKAEVREGRRDKARATYEMVIALALNRTEVVHNEDGSVAVDMIERLPDGRINPNYGKPLVRPKPDLQRVVNALTGMRHLDGLAEPFRVDVQHNGLSEQIPDVKDLPPNVREHLVRGLEALAPDGDLRKLAGELFAASARDAKLN